MSTSSTIIKCANSSGYEPGALDIVGDSTSGGKKLPRLNGDNYASWKPSVLQGLVARGAKLSEIQEPTKEYVRTKEYVEALEKDEVDADAEWLLSTGSNRS